VVERLLDAADELYGRADAGIERLPRDCRASIRAARLIYSEIGARLRARGCDPMLGRVSTSTLRKGVLLVRAYLHARKSERTPSPGGPLPEFAFLLAEPASHGPP
jgi:phytoene synthase